MSKRRELIKRCKLRVKEGGIGSAELKKLCKKYDIEYTDASSARTALSSRLDDKTVRPRIRTPTAPSVLILQPVPEEIETNIRPSHDYIENTIIPMPKPSNVLRLMTYNVQEWRNLDFNMSKKYRKANHDSGPQQRDIIDKLDPDVLAIQELGSDESYAIKQQQELSDKYYSAYCKTTDMGWFSILQNCVFGKKSALTQLDEKIYDIGSDRCLAAMIAEFGGMIVIFATVHFDVMAEYETGELTWTNEQLQNATNTLKKLTQLGKAYKTDKIILMGDFNNKSSWEPVKVFTKAGYTNAYEKYFKDNGVSLENLGPTQIDARIDHILISKGWEFPIVGAYTHYGSESDHHAVIVDIGLPFDL